MLLNSNEVNRFSEWNVWVRRGEGAFVSAFGFPTVEKPLNAWIDYFPEYAEYHVVYKGFEVKTRLMTAAKAGSVILSTVLTNTSDAAEFTVIPLVKPYLNPAALAMWDKPEWYVKTAVRQSGGTVDFYSRLFTPSGNSTKRRAMTYSATAEHATACQVDLDKVCGADDFFHPQLDGAVFDLDVNSLSEDFEQNPYRQGYPSVYAIRYSVPLLPNQSWEFSQVLSIQDKQLCVIPRSAAPLQGRRGDGRLCTALVTCQETRLSSCTGKSGWSTADGRLVSADVDGRKLAVEEAKSVCYYGAALSRGYARLCSGRGRFVSFRIILL